MKQMNTQYICQKKKNEKIKIAHIIMLKNVRALVENNVAILYIFV